MRALRRDFLPEHLAPGIDRQGDRCHGGRAGRSIRRRDAVSAWIWRSAIHLSRASSAGWICARRIFPSVWNIFRNSINCAAFVTWYKANRTTGFCCANDFCRGIARLREFGFTYDISDLRASIAGRGGIRRAIPGPAIHRRSHRQARHCGARNRRVGAAHARPRGPSRMCSASSRALITEADWGNWSRDLFEPYLATVARCIRRGPADVRLRLAGMSAGGVVSIE